MEQETNEALALMKILAGAGGMISAFNARIVVDEIERLMAYNDELKELCNLALERVKS